MKLQQVSSDLILGKGSSLRRWSITGTGSSKKLVMVLNLSDFKEHLDDALSLGSPMGSKDLELLISMCPFQLEIFSDSKSMEPGGMHP